MYLREKLDELKNLKQKIKELTYYLNNNGSSLNHEQVDVVVKYLLSCIEEIQNICLILNKVNSQTVISIGTSKIDVNKAVIIRDTISKKINLITNLLKNNKLLDVINLIGDRDTLLAEYNSINNAIRMADWSVKID